MEILQVVFSSTGVFPNTCAPCPDKEMAESAHESGPDEAESVASGATSTACKSYNSSVLRNMGVPCLNIRRWPSLRMERRVALMTLATDMIFGLHST